MMRGSLCQCEVRWLHERFGLLDQNEWLIELDNGMLVMVDAETGQRRQPLPNEIPHDFVPGRSPTLILDGARSYSVVLCEDDLAVLSVTRWSLRNPNPPRLYPVGVEDTPPLAFRICELALPGRLTVEEIGDGLEKLARLRRRNASVWVVWLVIASTVGWLLVNVFRDLAAAVRGKPKT